MDEFYFDFEEYIKRKNKNFNPKPKFNKLYKEHQKELKYLGLLNSKGLLTKGEKEKMNNLEERIERLKNLKGYIDKEYI